MSNLPRKYSEPDADFPAVRGPFQYDLPERSRPMPPVHNELEAIRQREAQQAETRWTVTGVVALVAVAVIGTKVAAGASVAPLIGGAICCAVVAALFRVRRATNNTPYMSKRCDAPKVTVTVETKVNVNVQ